MPRRRLLSALICAILVSSGAGPAQSAQTGTVEGANAVNIRSGPGTNHPSKGKLERGTAVEIQGTEGKWARVRHERGEGWVFAQFVAVHTPAPVPPTPTVVPMVDGAAAPDPSGLPLDDDFVGPLPPRPTVVEAVLPDEVERDLDRILTLTEAIHHDLERRRNAPPGPSQNGAGISLQGGLGLLGLGAVIGFFVGSYLGRKQERGGRLRV